MAVAVFSPLANIRMKRTLAQKSPIRTFDDVFGHVLLSIVRRGVPSKSDDIRCISRLVCSLLIRNFSDRGSINRITKPTAYSGLMRLYV